MLNNLETVLNEVPSEIEGFVFKYIYRYITIDVLFYEVKKRINLIANSYAYAIGYIHALNINILESFLELACAISNSKLEVPLMT